MFKKILSAVIALTMVMGMCSCSDSGLTESSSSAPHSSFGESDEPSHPSEPEEAKPDLSGEAIELTANKTFTPAQNDTRIDQAFINGINNFSVELFKKTVSSDLANDGKNTLVSPSSAAFALGMVANGANGNTLTEMQNVLCGGVDLNTFNRSINCWITNAHNNNNEKTKLSIANSVWVRDSKELVLNDQFAQNCKQLYNAEMYRAPFNEGTVQQVNEWVSDKTDNMINRIINRFSENEVMCLVNCIAFDSKWETQYSDDQVKQDQEFTNSKGDTVNCTMLVSKESQYIENGRAKGFIKEYSGGKYAFMAVLPNEDIDISNYVASMTADELSQLYNGRSRVDEVRTKLPEFKFDYSAELGDVLRSMGIREAFSNAADFSKMFENYEVAINRVIHKTHIELDAKGTKAAAATAVTMRAKSAVSTTDIKKVYLDRPFVFAIMDTETGIPVFIGTVCDPSVQ